MRYFVATMVLILLAPITTLAADLTCTVPAANLTRAVELCEELRLRMRVRTADWTNDVCATEFLRIGLLEGERRSTRVSFNANLRQALSDAENLFTSTWAVTVPATCGDSTVDTEFGETCDDGNTDPLDGCDDACIIEP